MCLLLEGIAVCAQVRILQVNTVTCYFALMLGSRVTETAQHFQADMAAFLQHAIYPLLARLGSPTGAVSETALYALTRIAGFASFGCV